jgi:tRNA pseudouridine38-40 synthase
MRYFLKFAYKGTHYHGWQVQPNDVSVQSVMTEKMSMVLRCPIELVGAGRTDAGVHARCMYAHFAVENEILDPP